MGDILEQIIAQKRLEVARLPAQKVTPELIAAAAARQGGPRDFIGALRRPRRGAVGLIAEVKKASPSAGIICPDFDPVRIAQTYEQAGASCLSVLTDERFFQGHLDYLRRIRAAVGLPILRKDFIIDDRQIFEAAEAGADAVLLIAAVLDDASLGRLHRLATEAGMAALVEVHDEGELQRAAQLRSPLIGVNNRNLRDFTVSLESTARLSRLLGEQHQSRNTLLVSESGICRADDVRYVAQHGAAAILVGEFFLKGGSSHAAARVSELLG
jgi:indole-3-glycerol phosphate synthase